MLDNLIEWLVKPSRKALILKGARQVGKTWIVRELARTHDLDLIELNFEKEPRFHSLFAESLDPDHILPAIEVMLKRRVVWQESLLFWDEVQECPRALTALKHFTDKAAHIPLIAAGSYLGMLEGRVEAVSQPVGYVDELKMTPLSFAEFVNAASVAPQVPKRLQAGGTPSLVEHEALIALYRDYLYVGGMPELVAFWFSSAENISLLQRLEETRELQKNLLSRLKADFSKYHPRDALFIARTWELVAEQLSRSFAEVNRFTFKGQIPGKRDFKAFASYFARLESCGLIHRTAVIEHPLYPLKSQNRDSFFKAYFFDVGLLLAEMDFEYQALDRSSEVIYKGPVAENFVALELVKLNQGLYCYKKSNSTAEIEFVLQKSGAVIPLEVKNNQTTAKSLRAFQEEYSPPFSIKLSKQRGAISDELIHAPLYLCEWVIQKYILLSDNKYSLSQ